jgi:uncharacterized protein (TIGR02246 family)
MNAAPVLAAALLAVAPLARACDADAAPVRAVAEGIIAADNERDIGRVLGFYTDDAVFLPPGEPPVTDRDAIRQRYEKLFADFAPAIEGRIDEICAVGDLAYVRGHNGGWLVSRIGGRSRELDDVYLMVLRRGGGDWKVARLMWHPAHGPEN